MSLAFGVAAAWLPIVGSERREGKRRMLARSLDRGNPRGITLQGEPPGAPRANTESMRQALTWEAPAPAFATPAGLRQKAMLAIAFALPVPLLAATGLTLPLPDSVYRLASAAVERTVAIAKDLPAVGHEQKREAPRPAVERTKAQPAAAVRAPATAPVPAKTQGHRAGTPARRVAAVVP